ncbi:MAG TPA: dienelactone hydrolase family protein [Stellaceae bacterium]
MTDVTIRAKDGGTFYGYLATPAGGAKAPGVVVIQEIFGVNKVMRDITDGLAAQGFTALCPDLFWRQEPGIQITDQTEAEWARAFELYKGFDIAKGVDDLAATLDFLRAHPSCTGKVGAVGYCLGGKLAFLMATRTSIDAAVGFYAVAIDENLGEAANIKRPVMLHVAEKDQFVPPEAQTKVKQGLAGNSNVTIHSYAGMDHAFARVGGAHYDAQAAKLANQRTADFFKQHLS